LSRSGRCSACGSHPEGNSAFREGTFEDTWDSSCTPPLHENASPELAKAGGFGAVEKAEKLLRDRKESIDPRSPTLRRTLEDRFEGDGVVSAPRACFPDLEPGLDCTPCNGDW
jgi:hypothetical protein